ncbi:hypothetical protein D9Q98_005879 [Chlorella vulgaris]|uniref:Alpha-amylase n=1 Tax=Chlorella vulgaris TaxID=3077 RepID=A0A9D4TXN9_CHLVU|nr:hypothetical protein D9Q98_005879 [Chlorella vulgaris]
MQARAVIGSCPAVRPVAAARAPCQPRRLRMRCAASAEPVEKVESVAEEKAAAPKADGSPAAAAGFADVQRPPRIPIEDTILFQGFGWDSCKDGAWYKKVESMIPQLQAAKITHLWLPPPSQSVAPQGYLPGQLYNLKSKYGNKEELQSLNRALMAAGIRPMADIVINHRCADQQDENGVWNKYGDDVSHDGKPINWDQWAITCDDPKFNGTGNPDSGDDYEAAPDLDHHNKELRDSLVDWLNWLKTDLGFEGWRFDYVRGFAAEYVKEYIERTQGPDCFNVGENFLNLQWNDGSLDYNQDGARQMLVDFVEGAKCCTMFDFVTKGILQEAVKNTQYDRLKDGNGKAPGMLGWWPEKTCTFIDNHDTGSSQGHWPFPNEKVVQGYAYILTHPGIPCLFWEHHFDWGLADEINALVELRLRAGIKANSKLEILCAEHDVYVARIDDKVTIKMGPRYDIGDLAPKESDGWKKSVRGADWCTWEKA